MLPRVFATATCLSVRPFVCPDVRHTPVLCLAERKQDREVYTGNILLQPCVIILQWSSHMAVKMSISTAKINNCLPLLWTWSVWTRCSYSAEVNSYKHSIDAEDLIYKLQLPRRLQIIITNYKIINMPWLHKIVYAKFVVPWWWWWEGVEGGHKCVTIA